MDRKQYLSYLVKTAGPALEVASKGRLRAGFPIEEREGTHRTVCSYFEWIGRLVCGIAPWLEAEVENPGEASVQIAYRAMTLQTIKGQFDPASPDYAGFNAHIPQEPQFLVDLAFLSQGLLRAPRALLRSIDAQTRDRILKVMELSRTIRPYPCNWILFSAVVEALIEAWTGSCDEKPVTYALTQMDAWYKGDGVYGDGSEFAADYYNSYVIHPMLETLADQFPELCGDELLHKIRVRSIRYAGIQYRMIAPDGSFPAIGRSITYRCGAFHHLADCALRHQLPEDVSPAKVREALGKVIIRTLSDENFRLDRALWIGLCAHQPELGENYISTGSLYLCLTAFLPLGLPEKDPFWTKAVHNKGIWAGEDLHRDSAYHETKE